MVSVRNAFSEKLLNRCLGYEGKNRSDLLKTGRSVRLVDCAPAWKKGTRPIISSVVEICVLLVWQMNIRNLAENISASLQILQSQGCTCDDICMLNNSDKWRFMPTVSLLQTSMEKHNPFINLKPGLHSVLFTRLEEWRFFKWRFMPALSPLQTSMEKHHPIY